MGDERLKEYPSLDRKWVLPREVAREAFFKSMTDDFRLSMNEAEYDILLWEGGFNRGLNIGVKELQKENEKLIRMLVDEIGGDVGLTEQYVRDALKEKA